MRSGGFILLISANEELCKRGEAGQGDLMAFKRRRYYVSFWGINLFAVLCVVLGPDFTYGPGIPRAGWVWFQVPVPFARCHCHFEPLATLFAFSFCPPCLLLFFPDSVLPAVQVVSGAAFRRMLGAAGF